MARFSSVNELGMAPRSFEIGFTAFSGGDDARTWSQRYKANLNKLASGDLVQIVEVVRDLAKREASRKRPRDTAQHPVTYDD